MLRFRDLGVFVFEFWVLRFRSRVLRFRVLGASFSRFGCFVFQIWVLRASVFVFECFVFETTPGLRALVYFRWNQFLFCYVLTGTGNLLDLWSFGRRLATAQVSVRIGKGRKILRLYYPYIDVFRVRLVTVVF